MAAFQAMKGVVANGGAVAVLTGFLSSGIIYAGKRAIAAEREPSEAVSNDGRRGLSCAPQFDGLECFETIVTTGKHPKTAVKTSSSSGNENWNLSCAPQFDGLDCFETIVSTGKHPRSVKQPSATEKLVPKSRGLALAPQFDGLHCFETFTYKK